jgi:bifunctional non-homologous end joining protein LigD
MFSAQRKPKGKGLHAAAVRGPMPSSVTLMLPTQAQLPFSDPEWVFEPKWDGFRAICFLKQGVVRFLSRNRRNLTRFTELQEIASLIKAGAAIIDGEIVALDKNGLPTFDGLRYRHRRAAIAFYAFDLLYVDGHELSQCPLIARKAALKSILPKNNTGRIRYTEHIEKAGERFFKELETLKLEGMVAKRKDSVYAFARSKSWLKIKTSAGREEMQKRIENWG